MVAMATKINFESGSDPNFFYYGLKLPCAKFQNSNMLSPIISHIASAIYDFYRYVILTKNNTDLIFVFISSMLF